MHTLIDKNKLALITLILFLILTGFLYFSVGYVSLILVGLPGLFSYCFWYRYYLKKPADPSKIIPFFLLSVSGFQFHLIEQYLGNYAQAISRLFNLAWTESLFFVVICCLSGLLLLISIGLFYKKEMAGFVAILFLSTRMAELFLFIFPLIKPKIQPFQAQNISGFISGTFVGNMPNYYYPIAEEYYFPGMYTWILTFIPAVYTLYRIRKAFLSNT